MAFYNTLKRKLENKAKKLLGQQQNINIAIYNNHRKIEENNSRHYNNNNAELRELRALQAKTLANLRKGSAERAKGRTAMNKSRSSN